MTRLLFALLFLLPYLNQAQGILLYKGKVTNAETKEPLTGATIQWIDKTGGTTTNTNGQFKINITNTFQNKIVVSYIGFVSDTAIVIAGQEIEINLQKTIYQADEVIVKATRQDRNSTSINNISAKQIGKINTGQDLPFLLNQTTSLVTTSDAGNGLGYTGMRIRGTDATRINVMVNGIPINDSESQGVYWVNMPDLASSVSSIQIQRGVGSSTNGTAAFGASINIQGNQFREKPYVESNNAIGSFDTYKNNLMFGTGLLNKKWALDARLSNINSDGYVDRAFSKLKSYYGTVAYYGLKSFYRMVNFGGKEKTYQSWNGVNAETLKTNRTNNDFTYEDQTDNYNQNHTQLLTNHTISSKINLSVNLHYTKGKGYYNEYKTEQNLANYGLKDSQDVNLTRQKWLDNHFFGTTFSAEIAHNSKTNSTLGGGWNKYLGDHFGDLQVIDSVSKNQPSQRWYFSKSTKTDFNIFYKNQYYLSDKIIAFLDLQYRTIALNMNGLTAKQIDITQNKEFNFFNPKIGANYTLNQNQNISMSYSIGQKEPNRPDFVDNVAGKTPKSEKLKDLELGFNHQKNNIKLLFNYYYMNYKDQLVVTGAINDVGEPIRTNIDNTFRTGLETEFSWQINQQWNWSTNLTISKNKVKDFVELIPDYEGNYLEIKHNNTDLAFSPNIISGSSLVYKPTKKLEIGLLGKYVGRQFLDNTSNIKRSLNPYISLDLRLNYSLKHIDLGFFVYNFTHNLYENNGYTYSYLYEKKVYTENYYYPQAGRNFMVSANIKF